MKKALLLFILFINSGLNAQVLLTEDGSTLLSGNVGTDFLGTNPGQGGWYTRTLVSSNGNNSNFQVVDFDLGGTYGNVIQITGYDGAAAVAPATSNSRFMYKNVATAWANRDFGNDITEVEYDFYTGILTTSSNVMRVALYDSATNSANPKVLGGIIVTMGPTAFSIRGISHYDPVANGSTGAVGAYSFGLGSNGAPTPVFSEVFLEPETWYKVGFSYNATTGEVKFKGANGLITRYSVQGAAAGSLVDNIHFIGSTGGTVAIPNTASSTGTFDNLIVKATATDTLLAVKEITDSNSNFSVYPNPVTNLISVSSKNNAAITAVSLTDLNGRIIKNQSFDTVATIEMNVTDLASGMYLMTIVSNEGTATKKIVKN